MKGIYDIVRCVTSDMPVMIGVGMRPSSSDLPQHHRIRGVAFGYRV